MFAQQQKKKIYSEKKRMPVLYNSIKLISLNTNLLIHFCKWINNNNGLNQLASFNTKKKQKRENKMNIIGK